MNLTQLKKIKTQTPTKRLGRGHSSGKGKTSARGQKGQKARGKVRLGFEGGQTPLFKRLPFHRGKGMRKTSKKPIAINLKVLSSFKANSVITEQALIDAGIVTALDARLYGVKVLGDGDITTPLTIATAISNSAKKKIEAAGGTVSMTADAKQA